MSIYQKIAINILNEMDKLQNSQEFKKSCPDISAGEYLAAKLIDKIKPQRLCNILSGKAHTRVDEIILIAQVLRVSVDKITLEDPPELVEK